MKTGTSLLIAILLLVVGLSNSVIAENLRIGLTVPLTGNLATYGNLIRGGAELAAEDLTAQGVGVNLFFQDTPLSGAGVITSLNHLVRVNKVDGIAGNFSNVAMAAMGPTIERAKIPTFHTSAVDPLILESGDYIISTNIRIKDEAYRIAEHLFTERGFHRLAVISIQTNFGQAYRKFFIERFRELGGEVSSDETFELSDSDYKTQLVKIRATNPHALFAACFGQFLGFTLKQARALGFQSPIYSVYESEDLSVLSAAGKAAEGLRYFVTTSQTSSPRYAQFRTRFVERYKNEPGTFGANAYDATLILVTALSECKGDNRCALKKIYATHDFQGVSGTFSIEADGAAHKNFILREVRNGAFIDVNNRS